MNSTSGVPARDLREHSGVLAQLKPQRAARGYWAQSWVRLKRNRVGIAAGLVLAALTLVAVAGPLISTYLAHASPDEQDLNNIFATFSQRHPLGTDELGRDTLTRLVYGARVSLGVGFLATALLILIGGAVGLVAGFYGGFLDDVLMRLVDVLLSIPTIYLLILLTALLPFPIGPPDHPWLVVRHDAISLSVVIAATGWGGIARLVRGQVLSVTSEDYILATRAVGASNLRLMLNHVIPNVLAVTIVTASLAIGQIILLEASLDFIGLGVQLPTASWGNMLTRAQTYFYHSALLVVLPGAMIFLAVMAANVFGNAVRDAFDPRLNVT